MYENVEKNLVRKNAYGIVMGIEDHGSYKEVICDDKSYEAKAVIIATGCEHRKIGCKKAKKNLLAVVFLIVPFVMVLSLKK